MGRPRKEGLRLRLRGGVWYATIRGADGIAIDHSTGERDHGQAEAVARTWEAQAGLPTDQNRPTTQTTTLDDVLTELLADATAKVRAREMSKATLTYYEQKSGTLLAFFGRSFLISAWEQDSRASWDYISWRRAETVAHDPTIKKELGALRTALNLAQERGRFRGNPALAVPSSFVPGGVVRKRSPTRAEFVKLVPHMIPDAAAVTAYILATSAEMAAIFPAKRSDFPREMVPPFQLPVRGTKTADRDRLVPIVTDEQVTLLRFVLAHAAGAGDDLFSCLANYPRTLRGACVAAGIDHVWPHALRHAAGQWCIDLGIPIEIVSKIMGHSNTAVTERVYARVKEDALSRPHPR